MGRTKSGFSALEDFNGIGEHIADLRLAEQPDEFLRELYERFKDDPQIKFKDSIKKTVGLERPTEEGLDI